MLSDPGYLREYTHWQARTKQLGKTPKAPRRKSEPFLGVRLGRGLWREDRGGERPGEAWQILRQVWPRGDSTRQRPT